MDDDDGAYASPETWAKPRPRYSVHTVLAACSPNHRTHLIRSAERPGFCACELCERVAIVLEAPARSDRPEALEQAFRVAEVQGASVGTK